MNPQRESLKKILELAALNVRAAATRANSSQLRRLRAIAEEAQNDLDRADAEIGNYATRHEDQ